MNCIHQNCLRIVLENDYFREKLSEFYKENKKLKEELSQFKNFSKSTIGIQTDEIQPTNKDENDVKIKHSNKCTVCTISLNKKNITKSGISQTQAKNNIEIYNQINKKSYVKLCEMQQSLLKKYEDEVNSNAVRHNLISKMKVELEKYESKCKYYEDELNNMRKKIDNLHELENKNKQLLIEMESYKLKYQSCQESLKLFDDDFFYDIENLKNNYDKIVRINSEYKKIIEKKGLKEINNDDFRLKDISDETNLCHGKYSKIKKFTREIIEGI